MNNIKTAQPVHLYIINQSCPALSFLKIYSILPVINRVTDQTVLARRLLFSFQSEMPSTVYPAFTDLDDFRKKRRLESFSSVCADAQADRLYSVGTCPQSHFAFPLKTSNFGRSEQ